MDKYKIKEQQKKIKDTKILNKFFKNYTRRNKQSTDMSNDSSKKPKIKIGSLMKKNNKN